MNTEEPITVVSVVQPTKARGETTDGKRFAAETNVGQVRARNEDSFLANGDQGLWVVADGMGGHGNGDVASRLVIEHITQAADEAGDLQDVIRASHEAVIKASDAGLGSSHMGSTIVAFRSRGNAYQIAWVGDSRAYLLDDGIRQITKDHSLVQQRLDQNLITAADAATDPGRGIITQCLGPANISTLEVGVMEGKWRTGDKILLCSDGLYEMVPAAAIATIIAGSTTVEAAVSNLINAALEAGGFDNITAILIYAPHSRARPLLTRLFGR